MDPKIEVKSFFFLHHFCIFIKLLCFHFSLERLCKAFILIFSVFFLAISCKSTFIVNCVPLGRYTCYCNQSNALCLQLKHEADEGKEAKLQGLNLCPEDCLKLEKKILQNSKCNVKI